MSDKQATDWMIYDAITGDLLDGPMNYEHARYLTGRAYSEAQAAANEGLPRHQPIAMARKGEMRRIQEGYRGQMSGNPPRDLRSTQ